MCLIYIHASMIVIFKSGVKNEELELLSWGLKLLTSVLRSPYFRYLSLLNQILISLMKAELVLQLRLLKKLVLVSGCVHMVLNRTIYTAVIVLWGNILACKAEVRLEALSFWVIELANAILLEVGRQTGVQSWDLVYWSCKLACVVGVPSQV